MEIKHLSEEDIRAHKEKFPLGEPKEWAVMDTDLNYVMGFFDTEAEAKAALKDWNLIDIVQDAFQDWAHKTAGVIGVDVEKLKEIVKNSL